MNIDFGFEPLGNFASIQGGFAYKSDDFTDYGVPVLKIKNVKAREIDVSEVDRVSHEIALRTSQYYVQPNDILISMTGSGIHAPDSMVGRVARYYGLKNRYLINQRVGRFVINRPDRLDARFLFFVLTQPQYQWELVSIATGSANQVNISGGQIESLAIPIPPLLEQRAIAHILGTLDDKIELNRRMNETLEALARAIFKSWFVDFDPVRAKMEGRQPVGIDAETAALFPGEFEDSVLGQIPQGWKVRTVEEISERVGMGPFGSSIKVETFAPEGVPIISGQHLHGFMLEDNTFNFITQEHAAKLRNAIVERGDVIFTHAGSIGQVAYIPENSRYERYVMSQRQFFMRCNPEHVSPSFMAFYFRSPEGQHQLLANTSSTGVPSISRPVTNLRSMKLCVPSSPVMKVFDRTARPLLIKYRHGLDEINTLAALRDTLLPKLLSGEVRVKG